MRVSHHLIYPVFFDDKQQQQRLLCHFYFVIYCSTGRYSICKGGTPDIIGAARLGLVMNLKQSLNCELLEKMELELGTQVRGVLYSPHLV